MPTVTKTKSTKNAKVLDFKGLRNSEKQVISRLIESSFSSGNGRALSKDKSALIVKNFPLAIHMAKKYLRSDTDIQDLIQVAAIGLIKAVKKYKTSGTSKLS